MVQSCQAVPGLGCNTTGSIHLIMCIPFANLNSIAWTSYLLRPDSYRRTFLRCEPSISTAQAMSDSPAGFLRDASNPSVLSLVNNTGVQT